MKQSRRLKRAGEAISSTKAKARNREKDLANVLLGKRQALVKELRRELAGHWGRVHREPGLDPVEQAGLSAEEEIGLTAFSQRTELVKQIDRTLEHLRAGTYGVCEYCGDGISIERLKVMPFAIRCTGCQALREASVALSRNVAGSASG
ncbi:MAG: TraR/DksA C4-type zinc finger protein [bacterium]|nr:TraR/DksA C4-type zinc finger protein [bacterium]